MSASMNLKEVPLSYVRQYIKDNLACGIYEPILVLSPSGVGKTEGIRSICTEDDKDIDLIEFRLSSFEETDFTGLPYINHDNEKNGGLPTTSYAGMEKLPVTVADGGHNKEVGILVLDEITATTRGVRACVLQLTDSSRSLGHYKLPDKWMVVMLGNGPEDGGMFDDFEFALMDRPSAYRARVDFAEWKKWAIMHDVHSAIIGFQSNFNGEELHKIKPREDFQEKGYSPRSWTKLSIILKAREKLYKGILEPDMVETIAAGYVGEDEAIKFAAFYSHMVELVSIEDILSGEAYKKVDIRKLSIESLYMNEEILINSIRNITKKNASIIEKGESMPDSDLIQIANVVRWIVKTGERSIDIGVNTLNFLGQADPIFTNIVVQSDEFDDVCPEFLEFTLNKRDMFLHTSTIASSKLSN